MYSLLTDLIRSVIYVVFVNRKNLNCNVYNNFGVFLGQLALAYMSTNHTKKAVVLFALLLNYSFILHKEQLGGIQKVNLDLIKLLQLLFWSEFCSNS